MVDYVYYIIFKTATFVYIHVLPFAVIEWRDNVLSSKVHLLYAM